MAHLPVKNASGATVYLKATGSGTNDSNAFVIEHLETNSAAMLTSLQLIDDAVVADNAAFTDGTTKLHMSGFIYDETAGTALTENDAAAARIDSKRAIVYVLEDATTRGRRATVSASGQLSVLASQTGTWTTVDAGDVAHDGVDSGNPIKVGGKARNANPAAVANGDRVDAFFDLRGKQIIGLNAPRELVGNQVTTITSSTTETTIVTAGGSGVYRDLTSLTVTNKSATGTVCTLKDASAGTTRGIYYAAAGGGFSIPFSTPKAQSSANAAWTLTSATSVDSLYITAEFINVA